VGTVVTSSVNAPSPQDFSEMFNLVGGYRISQAIYVVVELGIPDLLAAGPRGCEELARKSQYACPDALSNSPLPYWGRPVQRAWSERVRADPARLHATNRSAGLLPPGRTVLAR
jgi:hypothetical protein